MEQYQQILGVRFFIGPPAEAAAIGLRGGLVVAPAAPALVELTHDRAYRDALTQCDLALTDSGLMVLLWAVIRRQRIIRTSGLEYLRLIMAAPGLRHAGAVFWIMPRPESIPLSQAWLQGMQVPSAPGDFYVAPFYGAGAVQDAGLLKILEARKPAQVVICLGGGTQEKLGFFLKQNLSFQPGIHCIGAALGFLTGEQVNIPVWADRFFLGWFLRCCAQPRRFIPRYWRALQLIPLLLRHQESLPPLKSSP